MVNLVLNPYDHDDAVDDDLNVHQMIDDVVNYLSVISFLVVKVFVVGSIVVVVINLMIDQWHLLQKQGICFSIFVRAFKAKQPFYFTFNLN